MRPRLFVHALAFVLSTVSASCPRTGTEEAPPNAAKAPSPPAPPVAARPQLLPAAPPPARVAVPASSAIAAAMATVLVANPPAPAVLPPELADDGAEDVPEPDPPPPPVRGKKADPEQLASVAKETWVYAEPNWKARRIGYLRAGAIVDRRAEPAARGATCLDGWYRIEPRGFVCASGAATLDISDAVVEASKRRPRRDGLPYTYVMSRFPPPPLYARLPSAEEVQRVELDLKSHLRKAAQMTLDPSYFAPPPPEPVPTVLLYGRPAPALANQWRAPDALELGRARTHSGFALLSTFDHEARRYGLTTELAVLPIDRMRVIKPSTFAGIKLDADVTLPIAFVRSHRASRSLAGVGGVLTNAGAIAFRAAFPLTGAEKRIAGETYLEGKDRSLIVADQVVRIDRFHNAPAWATRDRKWIDVSILKQSLVAYEGQTPVYATLVSTGADGLGDPKTTHSTIQGAFLIHTKHLSVTMDDDKAGDEFDFRDVPFVQYFTEGFALHAAYWHDEFGTPRSHGCVNLAPIDAAWLFNWTDPNVPPTWHGALSIHKGTLVYIHP